MRLPEQKPVTPFGQIEERGIPPYTICGRTLPELPESPFKLKDIAWRDAISTIIEMTMSGIYTKSQEIRDKGQEIRARGQEIKEEIKDRIKEPFITDKDGEVVFDTENPDDIRILRDLVLSYKSAT